MPVPEPSPPLPLLPTRSPDSHKGDYGRALVIGGSRGMTGAVALAGKAALRGGAGLVTLGVPDVCLETVAVMEVSYMTIPLAADPDGKISRHARDTVQRYAQRMTCVGVGPGLGRSADLTELVGWMYRNLPQPMVVDADAINALAESPGSPADPGGPRVLTPHLGEFRRWVAQPGLEPKEAEDLAIEVAAQHAVVVVLKGHASLVTDGRQVARNRSGNPGMATGGSGDVLTGVIVALICQGLSPWEAAYLGVHVHGLAGDLAAQQLGQVSLIATDLVRFLPDAFRRLDEDDAS